jgi:hypothetical protein
VSPEVERLWRFLLGEGSEAERSALEDEYLADADRLASVESAEDELIDAYVCDELSPERRQRFEERFLVTASQRVRVALAKALGARAVTAARAQEAAATSRPRRRWRRLLLQAAAAALIVGAAGLAPRLIGWGRVTTVDVTLFPSSLRDEAEIPTVRLPAGKSRLQLRLSLAEPLRDDGDCDVLVTHELDEPRQLVASRAPGGDSLAVAVDAQGLAAGTYELTARIRRQHGPPNAVAVYAMRIELP